MSPFICAALLGTTVVLACLDLKNPRHQAIWEVVAGLLLLSGLALIGFGFARAF